MDAIEYLKTLLDRERLAVLGCVALTARTASEIAEATGLADRRILRTLAPLLQAGVVERVSEDADEAFRLRPEALRELARDLSSGRLPLALLESLAQQAPPAREVLYGMTSDEQGVLARFFRGSALVEIPSARAKRLVVLERLALEFEPGRHYAEREVNDVLARFHPDVASLRRHLVDEGFLDRAGGEYWRCGGRVEPAG